MANISNNVEQKIESKEEWGKIPTTLNEVVSKSKEIFTKSVKNILSDFWRISYWKGFKKYKVTIDWRKAKVISNTPELWIKVKFDDNWEIKQFSSISEINNFKILKEVKKHLTTKTKYRKK